MISQSQSQILGRAGERWFQSLLPRQWIFQKPEEDIGIDGKITIGNNEKVGIYEFAVQVKASKSWSISEGIITIEGIKSDTISYWGSRLYPTLIILYDDTQKVGYYGWAFDIVNHPIEFAIPTSRLKQKTVSLKLKSSQILNSAAFVTIEKDVVTYFEKFANSLKELRKTVNIIPTINRLTQSVRGIYLSHMKVPKTEDEARMLSLMMVVSHKGIINAMDELQTHYQLEIGSKDFIKYFIASYINEVNKFISEFDKFIYERDGAGAVWINPDIHKKITPQLIDFIFDIMLILTDKERKNRGIVFSFNDYDNNG